MGLVEEVLQEWRKRDPYLLDPDGFERFFEREYPKHLRRAEKEAERQLNLLVRVFTAPIIVHRCGWMDTVPRWLLEWIRLDRLIALMKKEYDDIATDAEALAYLVPRSLEASMGHEWTHIYLYLGTKVMREAKHVEVPKDVAVETLDDYEEKELKGLKRWIWERQEEELRRRRREEREKR